MFTTRRLFFSVFGIFLFPNIIFGERIKTPWQGEGPFYPNVFPEDSDNNLIKNGKSTVEAGGKILNLRGTLVDINKKPLKGIVTEIWQTDMNGIYLHRSSFGINSRDKKFQGFGRTITNIKGDFFFRTIIPSSYPGRTPHIHLKLFRKRTNILTTQLYIKGHPQNNKDFLFKNMNINEQNLNSMELFIRKNKGIPEYFTSVTLIV